jgi:mannose-6-phosphate isomerase-like protein (cupin superfamily)
MKREESHIQTNTIRIRVMEMLPGDATPWHFHREVTDHMVGLTGVIVVHLKQHTAMLELPPGQCCTVEVGRVHQVANDSPTEPASYLLIQGVGRHDFYTVD